MREKCLELLADSARASANKLKFFRLAFGAGGGFGEEIDTREAQAALEGMFGAERRIELGWMVAGDKLPKGAVKLLLNLALLAGDALVRGGRLDVGAENGDGEIEMVDPRRGAAHPARSGAARNAGDRGDSGGDVEPRAAGAWLAHQPGRRSGRLDPAVRPVERSADDRRSRFLGSRQG